MSIELMVTISAHTYLALFAGIFFYLVLLEAGNKHAVHIGRLKFFSSIALLSAVLSWGVKLLLLRDYFQGKLGFVTDASVTTHIHLFSLIQVYVFPTVILAGIILALVVWREGETVMERIAVRNIILTFAFIGFTLSAILMFLGVLLP